MPDPSGLEAIGKLAPEAFQTLKLLGEIALGTGVAVFLLSKLRSPHSNVLEKGTKSAAQMNEILKAQKVGQGPKPRTHH